MYYKRLIISYYLVLSSFYLCGQSLTYSYKWQFLGPDSTPPSTGSAGSWTATGMGWIESLYVYPDSQIMLAGSITNGIFLTSDGGEHWRQTLYLDPQVGVLDILVDGRKIYIATGATHFGEDFGLGLYRSRNKGKKWKPTRLEFLPENKTALWGESCLWMNTL